MSGFVKLEKRQVTAWKDGAVYKTKVIGFDWFPISSQPECYKTDPQGIMWVSTSDYHFGKEAPCTHG